MSASTCVTPSVGHTVGMHSRPGASTAPTARVPLGMAPGRLFRRLPSLGRLALWCKANTLGLDGALFGWDAFLSVDSEWESNIAATERFAAHLAGDWMWCPSLPFAPYASTASFPSRGEHEGQTADLHTADMQAAEANTADSTHGTLASSIVDAHSTRPSSVAMYLRTGGGLATRAMPVADAAHGATVRCAASPARAHDESMTWAHGLEQ